MKAYILNRSKSKSLTAQIRDAEQQLLIRQRKVGVRATTLIKKIHQEITAPSTLLLTVGIGFIIGELTRRQTTSNRGTANKQHTTKTSALSTALNLMTSVHTLYTALPIAWMIKSFHQQGASGLAPERQSPPVAAAYGTVGRRRRSAR